MNKLHKDKTIRLLDAALERRGLKLDPKDAMNSIHTKNPKRLRAIRIAHECRVEENLVD